VDFKEQVEELYFIYRGNVTIYDKKVEIPIVTLLEESYFGDIQILMNIRSNFRFRSSNEHDTYLYTLDKKIFKMILKDFRDEKKFLTLRAQRRYHYFKRMRE
jgi:signal-transduction protein with cAMP-binding, CBS, and nucleotidyltransferase domain